MVFKVSLFFCVSHRVNIVLIPFNFWVFTTIDASGELESDFRRCSSWNFWLEVRNSDLVSPLDGCQSLAPKLISRGKSGSSWVLFHSVHFNLDNEVWCESTLLYFDLGGHPFCSYPWLFFHRSSCPLDQSGVSFPCFGYSPVDLKLWSQEHQAAWGGSCSLYFDHSLPLLQGVNYFVQNVEEQEELSIVFLRCKGTNTFSHICI